MRGWAGRPVSTQQTQFQVVLCAHRADEEREARFDGWERPSLTFERRGCQFPSCDGAGNHIVKTERRSNNLDFRALSLVYIWGPFPTRVNFIDSVETFSTGSSSLIGGLRDTPASISVPAGVGVDLVRFSHDELALEAPRFP